MKLQEDNKDNTHNYNRKDNSTNKDQSWAIVEKEIEKGNAAVFCNMRKIASQKLKNETQ